MNPITEVLRRDAVYFITALSLVNSAAVTLIYRKRASNIILGFVLVFALLSQMMHSGRSGLMAALLGMVISGSVGLFLYLRGYLGAGDMKLLVAVGTLLGPVRIIYAMLIAGGTLMLVDVISLSWNTRRSGGTIVAVGSHMNLANLRPPFLRIPSGVAVVLGTNLSVGLFFLWR
ncbi:MAG: prepilin peptidase [Acidobacteria bacterium]|nr:prepilin peptidase [Acidobacteriota bacterium]MBI3655969.1 prepilin peptidase [Acidobacteriota bacterium]